MASLAESVPNTATHGEDEGGMMQAVWCRSGLAGLLALLALATLGPIVAFAHEPRDLGKYHVLVGWVNEPAIQGQPNAISILITDKATGQPVIGAEKTLKVETAYGGGRPTPMNLNPSDEVKGLYTASMIPTKAGAYVFTFAGSINGQAVNSRFESGPSTFDDVIAPESLEFPVKVPATADLAQQTLAANTTAEAALQRANLLGIAGIVLGVVGVILALVALLVRGRPTYVPVETPPTTSPQGSAQG